MSHTFSFDVSDVEFKAFELLVSDPDEWVEHAGRNKIRKAAIRIIEEHVKDPSAYLTPADKAAIKVVMEANDDTMKEPKHWSNATKAEIINRSTMPTRAERDAAETP